MRYRLKASYAIACLCAAIALAIYGYGLAHSPLINPEILTQRQLLAHHASQATDPEETRHLANAYWLRNPDVSKDPYYGRDGKLGDFGAAEHFRQHGKKEGRRWGR